MKKMLLIFIAISLISTYSFSQKEEKRKFIGNTTDYSYFLWLKIKKTPFKEIKDDINTAERYNNEVTEEVLVLLKRHKEYEENLINTTPNPNLITKWQDFQKTYNELTRKGLKFYMITLKGIEFSTASATLNPKEKKLIYDNAIKDIENYIKNLISNKKYHIYIDIVCEGYTDTRGKPENNQILSEARAKSVLRYIVDDNLIKLEQNGIFKIQHQSYKGFGEYPPAPGASKKTGNVKERRVVVVYRYVNWDK